MLTVKQLLQTKGTQVWSIPPDAMVFDALQLMAEKDIGALLVSDGGNVAGILSERDYARKIILLGKLSKETPVSEIMTRNVISVTPDTSVEECMELMTRHHIRHLPVFDQEKVAGIISIGDVVKAIISEQELMIGHLTHYITGR